ncbi:MAG: DNA-binding response regulator [Rhizobiales bacterium PAR1]|nr:MAG: DNA-binding response regulator [Rhizobiales bacterium PAR1]
MISGGLVYLIDDDFDVREGLTVLMRTHGLDVTAFDGGITFLEALPMLAPGCLLIDIRMPHITGLRLQERLAEANCDWPTIIITGHGDIEACRRAFKSGAVDFLTKPIEESVLIAAVRTALARLTRKQAQNDGASEARRRLSRLTTREAQILALVADGLTTKEIARQLDISPRTIETHRTHIGEKLGTGSVAAMVKVHLAAAEDA